MIKKDFEKWYPRLLVKMDKIWHRGIINYLQKRASKNIHANLIATLGDDAPALSTVKKWEIEFKKAVEFRERVENILHQKLGMSKVSARWLPHLLTPAQKQTRLVMFQRQTDPPNCLGAVALLNCRSD